MALGTLERLLLEELHEQAPMTFRRELVHRLGLANTSPGELENAFAALLEEGVVVQADSAGDEPAELYELAEDADNPP